MSYILDALRRAEAERERGAVPSLASQQHSIEIEEERPQRSRGLVFAVIGLAFALVATIAWTWLGPRGAPARASADATPLPVTAAPAPAPQSLAEIAATPSAALAPATVPAVPTAAAPTLATAPPAPPSFTAPAATTQPTSPPPTRVPGVASPAPRLAAAAGADSRRPGTVAASGVPALAPAVAAAASEPRIYAQAELPDDIRRDLPRIAINGSSYSGDAASRMVMINGQVFHEGDALAAGLVLDKIRRRSAVLAYKGYRYEISF